MSQKSVTPEMWEQLFKRLGVPSGPEEDNKPVHYFNSYTNANIREARRFEKQGFRCLFPDPRGPTYMSSQESKERTLFAIKSGSEQKNGRKNAR